MTKFIYTIWALLLHCTGKSLFRICFVDVLEDNDGNNLPFGPPMISFIFALGVYVIISNLNFYPETFRKPIPFLMGLYEFMVTAFILEFSLACIWVPIDVYIYVILRKMIYKILSKLEYNTAAKWILDYNYPMSILCYIIVIGFLLVALYVTRSSDFILNSDFKPKFLVNRLKAKVSENLINDYSEFEEFQNDNEVEPSRKRGRKRKQTQKVVKTNFPND